MSFKQRQRLFRVLKKMSFTTKSVGRQRVNVYYKKHGTFLVTLQKSRERDEKVAGMFGRNAEKTKVEENRI
jgi:hypothetical protein